jgi:hypothetical protein
MNGSGRAFCTYFDHRYLPRALTLFESLRQHGSRDEIWALCMTETCAELLTRLKPEGVHELRLSDLEEASPSLLSARSTRSTIEFYFTCTPLLIQFVFAQSPLVETVTYLDADIYFFGPPEDVFAEIGAAPVAIIPHNYPPRLKRLERFGIYNVGWVSFARGEEAQACLRWWAESCLAWCYDYVDADGRFADQGYLNWFPEKAPHLAILRHPGMNLAPWNVANSRIEGSEGRVTVDGRPLLFFHFHGVRRRLKSFYFSSHRVYHAPLGRILRNAVYRPYIAEVIKWEAAVNATRSPDSGANVLQRGSVRPKMGMRDRLKTMARLGFTVLDLLQGKAILVRGKNVY